MKNWIGHISLSLVIVSITLMLFRYEEIDILGNQNNYFSAYSDSDISGTSECSIVENENAICYKYTLRDTADYPYGGMSIGDSSFYDLSEVDDLEIQIQNSSKRRFHIFYSIVSLSNKIIKYRTSLETSPGKDTYIIALADFNVPTWYIKNKGLSEKDINESDLSHVNELSFSNDLFSKMNQEDQICITSIKGYPNNTLLLVLAFSLLVVLNIFLWLIRRAKAKLVTIEYKASTVIEPNPEDILKQETDQIIRFIGEQYSNPELNLRLIRKSLKIPENKISQLLKQKFGMSYKDYIINIRLEESKRLLANPALNINEVATAVGFGSISTFNRVFKDKIGTTPTDYSNSINS